MRLADAVANGTPSFYAEVGLVIFLATFVAVGVWVALRWSRTRAAEAAALPFDDGTPEGLR